VVTVAPSWVMIHLRGKLQVSSVRAKDSLVRETTGTLRGLELDRDRISLASGRDSDIRPAIVPGDDTETTFVFNVPPRDVSEEPQFQSDDVSDSPTEAFTQEEEDNDEDTVNGINTEGPEVNIIPELEGDINMQDTTIQGVDASIVEKRRIIRKKVKISKHGIQYPSFPAGVVKKLATTFARTAGNSKAKISKETLDAIMQASDWFFEQVSDDLGAYAKHAGRQTIDESDIVTLMARSVLPSGYWYYP
jgi:histone H3/H4